MRRVPAQRAIMRHQFAVRGIRAEHLRDRTRVAGPDEAAGEREAERRTRRMVARGEHVEPERVAPETARHRYQAERVPEVRAAFGQHLGIVGDARLQQWHERRMRVQAHVAAQRRVEIGAVEQPLEARDVVHVRMRDVHRRRRRAVVIEVGGQRLRAAVDHQQWRPFELDHGAGGTELGCLRIAHTQETQAQLHRSDSAPASPRCAIAS